MGRDPAVTSKIMASIRSRDTKPEMLLRRAFHARGLRFRVSPRGFPGRPDIVFRGGKLAIFVDGDFWHGNSWRVRGFASFEEQFKHWGNSRFWTKKIRQNVFRDRRVDYQLLGQDWKVLRFWESEIQEDLDGCVQRTTAALSEQTERRYQAVPITSMELFTGAGGLALGVAGAGFQHLAVMDWDANACATLRQNQRRLSALARWPIFEMDVHQFDFEPYVDKVSLLACGAPCQPFSLGGKHRGEADDRNMFPEVFRAARIVRPEAIVVENVKGLLRSNFQPYFEYILLQLAMPERVIKQDEDWQAHKVRLVKDRQRSRSLSELRYDVYHQLVNCADFGVPQCRERVFMVAFRSDLRIGWDPIRPTHSEDALLYSQWVDGAYWREHGVRTPPMPERLSARVQRLSGSLIPPTEERWRTVRDALRGLPKPLRLREHPLIANHVENPGARVYPGHTGSPYDWPAKTLKAGDHGVPGGENILRFSSGGVRYFTVREAARLQTFPDDYRFSGAWSECLRQLGNAVPVRVAHLLSCRIRERLVRARTCPPQAAKLEISGYNSTEASTAT